MSEEKTPSKSYFVKLPGFEQGEIWDEEKYNRNKDRLFNDHNDAQVVETSAYNPDSEIADNDAYMVHLPGFSEGEMWDGAKLARNREQLLKDHPDVEITKTRQVDYFGDQLGELYDKKKSLQTELSSLPADEMVEPGTDPRAIQGGSIAEMQDIVQKRREAPSVSRRLEINREINQINEQITQNPAWQRYQKHQDESINQGKNRVAELQKQYEDTMKGPRGIETAAAAFDDEYLKAANRFYDDAKKVINAPSRYGETGPLADFWQGVKDTGWSAISIVDLANNLNNLSLLESAKNIQEKEGKDANIRDLVLNHPEKLTYMSDAEKEMWKAFIAKGEAEASRNDDMSRMYQAGQSAAQSLGFMADFLATGGIGESVAKKAINKVVGKDLLEAAGRRELAKIGAETLYGTAKSLVMTPLMPSSYSNFINNLTRFDDNEGIDLSGKALRKAAGDVIIENVSETIGSKPMELIGKPLSQVAFPAWAKAMRNSPVAGIMKQSGYNGFLEEMVEEWTGNALRVMTGVDENALKDFATLDQQLITAASFAPMAAVGLGATTIQYTVANRAMKSEERRIENLIGSLNVSDDVKKAINDSFAYAKEAETPEDFAHRMTDVSKQIVDNGGNAKDVIEAAMLYTKEAGRYKVLTGMFEEQKDIDRSRKLMEMDGQMQNAQWHHYGDNGASYVRTITDQEGNERFVAAQNNGELALVDREGKPTFMTEEELAAGIAEGTLTDSGEMSLFAYLDGEVEADNKKQEQARMQTESQSAFAELQRRAQPGVTVNVGSVENPQNGTIMGFQAGKYIVQTETGVSEYTPEEMANVMGIKLTPETDEQIEAKEVEQAERMRETRRAVIAQRGKTFATTDGRKYTIVGITRDTTGASDHVVIAKDDTGTTVAMQMGDDEVRGIVAQAESQPTVGQPAVSATPEAAPLPEPVDDGTPRDFRGNPLPMRTNSVTGEQEVDGNALWNADPEAWVRWNDSNPTPDVTSDEKLEYAIGQLTQQVAEAEAAVKEAVLNGTDQSLVDTIKASQSEARTRLQTLEGIRTSRAESAAREAENAQGAAVAQEQTPTPSAAAMPTAQTPAAAPRTVEQAMDDATMAVAELDRQAVEAKEPGERQAIMEAKAIVLQQMLDELGAKDTKVVTRANVVEEYRKAGGTEEECASLQQKLAETKQARARMRGFYSHGRVFIIADDIVSAADANIAQLHEAKHLENARTGAVGKSLATGVTTAEMKTAIKKLTGSEFYDEDSRRSLADEVFANAEEIAEKEGVAAVPQRLREAGITNEEFINFVTKNIEDGRRRNGERRHLGGRDALQPGNTEVSGQEDVGGAQPLVGIEEDAPRRRRG